MAENIIVMPGRACFDFRIVHGSAQGFGWTIEVADDLHAAAVIQASRKTIAVLFHREALGSCSWQDGIRALRRTLPDVRPIACHGFSESADRPGLCDAGAFHSLWLPMKEDEVRRALGFVWAAERRAAPTVPMVSPRQKTGAAQRMMAITAREVNARVMVSASGQLKPTKLTLPDATPIAARGRREPCQPPPASPWRTSEISI